MSSRLAVCICVIVALLSGCGAPQAPNPSTGALSPSGSTGGERRGSWMLPEAAGDNLLYAANWYNGNIYVFSYPQGKLVGTLAGFDDPGDMCVDAAGDVWIPNYSVNSLIEYAHGGTVPIATLQEGTNAEPNACSIDPTTGDLATSNRYPYVVAVFKNASGSPTFYSLGGWYDWIACAYDPTGNLFAASFSQYGALAELPHGGDALSGITLNQAIHPAASMQWDGTYMAIRSVDYQRGGRPTEIDRIAVSGSTGRVVATVKLADRVGRAGPFPSQYFIFENKIIGADRYRGTKEGPHAYSLDFWRYPNGGSPIRVLSRVGEISGAVISPAATHTTHTNDRLRRQVVRM